MSTERSLPDLIADKTARASGEPAQQDRVRRQVLSAFGCTCAGPSDGDVPQQRTATCPVHSSAQPPPRDDDPPIMPSLAGWWEDDPYHGYSPAERRENVQDNLRAATEFTRALRADLDGTVRRAHLAQEHLADATEHARFNGGLTEDELCAAETALAAVQYALRLLYAASNHVGDQPGHEAFS